VFVVGRQHPSTVGPLISGYRVILDSRQMVVTVTKRRRLSVCGHVLNVLNGKRVSGFEKCERGNGCVLSFLARAFGELYVWE
jgi:hypothetical protein